MLAGGLFVINHVGLSLCLAIEIGRAPLLGARIKRPRGAGQTTDVGCLHK
jgi:hypothetical protein